MPTFLVEMLSQVKGIWARLDGGQRLTIVAVLLATLAGLGGIVWYAGRPDYQEVFSSDDPSLLSEARTALSGAGISFRTEGNGLQVDRLQVSGARAVLADNGISNLRDPETDDKLGDMTLDSVAKADRLHARNCRRAEFAIRHMDGVRDVRVTASKPKRPVYAALDKETQARANVVLSLRGGASATRIAAAARETVAAALSIPPEQITVTDAQTLTVFRADPSSGGSVDTSEFLAQQDRRARELSDKAQAMLDRMYRDKSMVVVTVDLDPKFEQSREKIVPETPIVLTDKKVKSDVKEASSGPAGDPSTVANTSAAAPTTGNSGNSLNKSETTERTYEGASGERTKGMLAPDIRKLTVSLVLDETLKLDNAKIAQLTAAVQNAVGWDKDRGDPPIAVLQAPFEAPAPDVAAPGPSLSEMVKEYGPPVGQVVGVVVVVLFLRSLLRKGGRPAGAPRKPKKTAEPELPPPTPEEEEALLPPEEASRRMRREIEQAISEDPATISRMLESWLAELKS